jgi:hypothetical protein
VCASTDLEVRLNARLAAGERLLAGASIVASAEDHRPWQSSRDLWVGATAKALAGLVDDNLIRTFSRAATPPPGEGTLAEDFPVELEAVREAMAVLVRMRSQADRGTPHER